MAHSGAPQTIADKIWDQHSIAVNPEGDHLLWIDRHYVHEGSNHGFGQVASRNSRIARPDLTFGVADHYVPTRSREPANAEIARMIEVLDANAAHHGFQLFGMNDKRQGIVHVTMPEQGLTLPGLTIVCGDSHTSTHGAFGAYAFGIGASEVAHVLLTQTLWQRKPRQMRITVNGILPPGVSAKDMALTIIAKAGAGGATGHAIEYAGSAIRALSVEGRMTLCNLSIESGSRLGIIAPDEKSIAYLRGRAYAPAGDLFEKASEEWLQLASDQDAIYAKELVIDGSEIEPSVTWGTSPEQALPITGCTPDPALIADEEKSRQIRESLDYMGLRPGQALEGLAVDQVFIGSCTNSRIEDIRIAAAILAGRKSRVPGLVSAGSMAVKLQAEQEGLDRIFIDAGLEWGNPGCSMCVGMNGDLVAPGKRSASTTNRNFRGRQGPGARTHLVSPMMAAAAAVAGCLTDGRAMLEGRTP